MADPIVVLESIAVAGVAGSGALAMLEDGVSPVPTPEWVRSPARSAPIAWVSRRRRGAPARTIRATFTASAAGSARVRASVSSSTLTGAVTLGSRTVRLTFAGTSPQSAAFGISIPSGAVDRGTLVIRWQQIDGGARTIEDTTHEVAITLDEPAAPWLPGRPGQADLVTPWWPAVDAACRAAKGATTPDDIATAIAAAYFKDRLALPPAGYKYEPSNDYASSVGISDFPYFDFARFLTMLEGGNEPRRVDCCDTTAAVTTFANAIGGRLQGFAILHSDPTQPITLVGRNSCVQQPFGLHQVALTDPPAGGARVWDGCLTLCAVDGQPALTPLAVDSDSYATRLYGPAVGAFATLEADDAPYRPIRPTPTRIRAVKMTAALNEIADRVGFQRWGRSGAVTGGTDERLPVRQRIFLERGPTVLHDVYQSESIGDARLRLLALLARLAPAEMQEVPTPAGLGGEHVVFVSRRFPLLAATFDQRTVLLRTTTEGVDSDALLKIYPRVVASLR